jgi:hypothetical protein
MHAYEDLGTYIYIYKYIYNIIKLDFLGFDQLLYILYWEVLENSHFFLVVPSG